MKLIYISIVFFLLCNINLIAQAPSLTTTGSTANNTTICSGGTVNLVAQGQNLTAGSVKWIRHTIPNPSNILSGVEICDRPIPVPPPTDGSVLVEYPFTASGGNQAPTISPAGYLTATNLTISNGSYNQSFSQNACDWPATGSIYGGPFNGGSFGAPPNYYQFTVTLTPPTDCTVEISSISVDFSCSQYGPKNFKVTMNPNSTGEQLLGQGTIDSCSVDTPPSGSCSGFSAAIIPSITNGNIVFRIYGWGGTGANAGQGKLRLKNLKVEGTYTCQSKYTGPIPSCEDMPDCNGATSQSYYYFATFVPSSTGIPTATTPAIKINVNCPTVVANNNGPKCLNTTVNLTSSASGLGPFTYSWTGPNGYTSSAQNPVINNINASQFGDYTVVVTGAGGCTASATTTVSLSSGFTVDIYSQGFPLPSDITVCQGINTTLTAIPNGGVAPFTYKWNTGPTSASITVSPTSNTVYKVTVTDNTGCTDEKSVNVTVMPIPPTLAPLVSSNSPICEGDEIKLNYLSLPGVPQLVLDLIPGLEYKWTGPNGFAENGKNVVIPDAIVAMTGQYKLTLEVSGCKSKDGIVNVTVKPAPATFSPGDQKKCADDNGNATFNLTTLNNTISGGTGTVSWWLDDKGTIPLNPPNSFTVNIADSPLKVYAKVTNNGCTSKGREVTLIVNPLPTYISNVMVEMCKAPVGLTNFNLLQVAQLVLNGSTDIVKFYKDVAATQLIVGTTYGVNSTSTIYAVVNNANCSTAPFPVQLIVNTLPDVIISPANASFCTGDSVLLSSNVTNGTPIYAYKWSLPNSTNSDSSWVNAKISGTYNLTVTDSKGCIKTSFVQVSENGVPKITISPSNTTTICKDSVVFINLNVIGGNPAYIYNWKTPDSTFVGTNSYSATSNGNYSITVTDQNNCKSIAATQIIVNENPLAKFDSTIVEICNGSTFSTPILFTGKAPFTFSYSINNQNITTLTTSNNPYILNGSPTSDAVYKLISISDANNCSSLLFDSILVHVHQPITISGLQDSCLLNNTYIVIFNINPGIPNTPKVTGSVSGTITGNQFISNPIPVNTPYNFTISNQGLCPDIQINGIKKICNCDTKSGDMSLIPINLCDGESQIASYLGGYFSDGNDTLQFVLHDGNGKSLGTIFAKSSTPFFDLNIINGIVKGKTYYISAIAGDNIGNQVDLNDLCLKVSIGTPIQLNEKPTAIISGNNTICYGDTSILKITVTGTPPFVLKYEEGGNINTLNFSTSTIDIYANPASSTSYNLLNIKDKYCTTTLNQNFALTVIQPKTGTFSPTVCIGETFTYNNKVYNALNSFEKVLLKNGAASGCDSIVDFKLNFFPPVVNNIDQILCYGQILTVNSVQYSESKPTGTELIKNGASNGCDSTINVNLTFTNAVINNLKPILCVGENIVINGKTYDNSKTIGSDTLIAGSYSGCDSIINVNLSFYPISNSNFSTTLCLGETIKIGNTTFSESNTSGTVTLPNQSSHGCDSIVNVSIAYFPRSTGNFNKTLCSGEKITIGGKSFSEQNPIDSVVITKGSKNGCDTTVFVQLTYLQPVTNNINTTICPGSNMIINGNIYGASGKMNGKETILNGAKNGCDSIINVNLSFYPAAINTINNSLCVGQQLNVNGKVYNQLNPKGTEVIKNATKNGCDSTIFVDLKFISPSIKTFNNTICKESSLTVNGKIYNFSKPSGIDTLKNSASSGCDSIIQVNLSFYPKDTFYLNQQLCEGQSVTVNNVNYNQNKTSGIEIMKNQSKFGCDSIVKINLTFNKPSTNLYRDTLCIGDSRLINGKLYNENNTETIKNGNSKGCDSTIQVNLVYRPDIVASISGNSTICKGKSVSIPFNISGGSTYDVVLGTSTGNDIVLNNINGNFIYQTTPITTTTYFIKSIKINGLQPCKTTILGNYVVNVDDLSLTLKLKNYNGFNVSCPGSTDGVATIVANNVTSNLSIQWSNGKTGSSISGLGAGTYYVTITSLGGCSAIDSAVITQPNPLDITANIKSPKCYDGEEGEISINQPTGGATPITFSTDNKTFFPALYYPFVYNHKKPGKYTVYIKDANGCKSTKIYEVPNVKKLELELGVDTTIHFGDSIQLHPTANFDIKSFVWTPKLYLNCDTCINPIVKPISDFIGYNLMAVDSLGCSISDNITIRTFQNKHVFIPNTFTPDDEDGTNTIFYIYGSEEVALVEFFAVFDRWGNQLFKATNFFPNDPQYGWDGKFNSKRMNPDVYVYYAKVKFKDGTEQILKGDVTIYK